MTAEFAAALPAALLCLALCLGAVQAVAQQSRLEGAAAVEARQLGRGEAVPGGLPGGSSSTSGGGERSVEYERGMVCVTMTAPSEAAGLGGLGVTVRARQCALDEEAAGRVPAWPDSG